MLGNADSRQELQGALTLEAIQERHRRLRGQLHGLTPELAGIDGTQHPEIDGVLQQLASVDASGDGPAPENGTTPQIDGTAAEDVEPTPGNNGHEARP